MDDLSLIPSEDLIQELFKRHDAVLVVRYSHRTENEEVFAIAYQGTTTCIGLAERAKRRLLLDIEEEHRECEE